MKGLGLFTCVELLKITMNYLNYFSPALNANFCSTFSKLFPDNSSSTAVVSSAVYFRVWNPYLMISLSSVHIGILSFKAKAMNGVSLGSNFFAIL